MKRPLLVLALAALAAPAHAQLDYYGRLGLTGSSTLVRDVLFQPFETKQGLSPTLVAGLSIPVGTDNRLGIEAQLTSGSLEAETTGEGAESTADLGRLTTLSALANAEGAVTGPIRWRIGIGLIQYLPSEEAGLFAQGGPLRYFVGGGLDFRRPAFSSWDLMISARYDFHRFTTDELRDRGFTQAQGVQRGSLTVGLARSRRIAP
ncbi:MAG TPA: hypothetical protein VFZ13_05785 [Gemmatimonadales bacterium]